MVSSLVYQEISFGAFVGRSFANQMASLNSIIDGFPIEPFTWLDAKEAARVRADLCHQGPAIDGLDALIAGQALARGWSVATSNLRHFQRVAGLTVVDWTP